MKLARQTRTNLTGYLFLLPNILGVLAFVLLPLVFSLFISFTDWNFIDGLGNWQFNGGQNYIQIWSDNWFTSALKNTIVYSVAVVAMTVALALVLAVVVDRFCWGRTPMRLSIFLPYMCNYVAVAIIWVMMYSPWGPFTQMVQSLGIKNVPLWLSDKHWSLRALMIMSVWANVGYGVMIYSAAIQNLPLDIYEAADVDGANEWVKFIRLTVPSLSPTTFYLVTTTLITSFQVFAPVLIMTKGGPGTSSNVLVYYLYKVAFNFYHMGYASSIAWVMFMILLVFTLIQWRGQQKWVSY